MKENKGCKDTRLERKKWVHVYLQKGEHKPILFKALFKNKRDDHNPKRDQKIIIPIFEYDTSLHDLQGLA
jgi:hypothetical protein